VKELAYIGRVQLKGQPKGYSPGKENPKEEGNLRGESPGWESLNELTIHTFKDIEEGEEITISYLGGSQSYTVRQLRLKNSFGFDFDCACELCSLPSDQRRQSDQRLAKITRLDRLIGDGMGIISTPVACLHDAHALLRLLEEEGEADARIPRPYYDALQIVIASGDQARAKAFAERAYAARVCSGGRR
jgi:hypothetical protein